MKTENEKTILKLKRQIREVEKKNLELDLEIEEAKVIKSLRKELFQIKNQELIELRSAFFDGIKFGVIAIFTLLGAVIQEICKASDRYEAQVNNRNPLPGVLR